MDSRDVAQLIAKKRALKAVLLADALQRVGCGAATARQLGADGRRDAERAAMVRTASEETWQVVFAVLERRETMTREGSEAHERELLGTR